MYQEHPHSLDAKTIYAHILNGLIILSTIQAQDFGDVEGDALCGRRTLPIVFPEASRHLMTWSLPVWSAFLAWFWEAQRFQAAALLILGLFCGLRFMIYREVETDRWSYVYYNVSDPPIHAGYHLMSVNYIGLAWFGFGDAFYKQNLTGLQDGESTS